MLRIDASGVFDLQIARSYATDIKRIVADLRDAGSKLRVVVDRIESRVLEPGVAQILIDTYRAVLRPGDRVALVVQTSMDKAPIRTVADREETQVFLSMSAAKTWVLAYD
jgi:hypothetical protein